MDEKPSVVTDFYKYKLFTKISHVQSSVVVQKFLPRRHFIAIRSLQTVADSYPAVNLLCLARMWLTRTQRSTTTQQLFAWVVIKGTKGTRARMLYSALLMENGMIHHCIAAVSEVQEFNNILLGFVFVCFLDKI